jgi:L-serine deaminase
MPTKKPARITEIALAPTAGAKGVDPDDPAPIAHAMKRLAAPATRNVATVPAATISPAVQGAPLRTCRDAREDWSFRAL